MRLEYEIFRDKANDLKIASVGGDWDKVALENGCDEVLSHNIIGQKLLHYVSGDMTRMWVEAMVHAVLVSGKNRVFPYRCDTPNLRRQFTMSVKVQEARTVLLQHALVNVEQMQCNMRFKYDPTPKKYVPRCSMCNAVQTADGWMDPFDLGQDQEISVIYRICPECR